MKKRMTLLRHLPRGQRGDELGVGLDPRIGGQPGFAGDAAASCSARSRSQRQVDTRHAADQVEQALRRAQADIDVAGIDALVAEVEQAGDGQRSLCLSAVLQAQLVADLGAEILGQVDADHRLAGTNPQLPGGQPFGQGNNPGCSVPARCRRR